MASPSRLYLSSTIIQHFFCDLFSMLSNIDFASYEDNNTSDVVNNDINEAIEKLEQATIE